MLVGPSLNFKCWLFTLTCTYVYLSVCLSVCMSICMYVCLYVCLCVLVLLVGLWFPLIILFMIIDRVIDLTKHPNTCINRIFWTVEIHWAHLMMVMRHIDRKWWIKWLHLVQVMRPRVREVVAIAGLLWDQVHSSLICCRGVKSDKTGNYRLTYWHENRSFLEYRK